MDKEKINLLKQEKYKNNPEPYRKSVLLYQKENKDKVNEAHRIWYHNNKEKIKKQRDQQKQRFNEWQRQYQSREEVKFRKRANAVLNYHVKCGNIVKPNKCKLCEEQTKLESHHKDYNEALKVIWVCRKCHIMIHKSLNKG